MNYHLNSSVDRSITPGERRELRALDIVVHCGPLRSIVSEARIPGRQGSPDS